MCVVFIPYVCPDTVTFIKFHYHNHCYITYSVACLPACCSIL